MHHLIWLSLLAACGGSEAANVDAAPSSDAPTAPVTVCGPPVARVTVIHPTGWAAHWSHVTDRIAFNKEDPDGIFRMYTMAPDGTDERKFGEGNVDFPAKNAGSPNWHPSGRYVAFVAEKAEHPGASTSSAPGWGGYSDLWVATADGAHAWKLTDTPVDDDHGTLIPIFSPDGTQLLWTERTRAGNPLEPARFAGYWVLRLADFTPGADDATAPTISNIRTIQPGGVDAFNESGGFSLDGQSLFVTSSYLTQNFWSNQIFRIDLATGTPTPITELDYNEHPRATPDSRVLWMSGKDTTGNGTDWWLVDADGTNPARLSTFNEPGTVDSRGREVWAGSVPTENWSPDGTWFVGEYQTDLLQLTYEMVKVELTCAPAT